MKDQLHKIHRHKKILPVNKFIKKKPSIIEPSENIILETSIRLFCDAITDKLNKETTAIPLANPFNPSISSMHLK